MHSIFVIPAQSGIQRPRLDIERWTPACAGVTEAL